MAYWRRCGPSLIHDLRGPIAWSAKHRASRRCLNLGYNLLPWRYKAACHTFYAKALHGYHQRLSPGSWVVRFAGRRVALPLGKGEGWIEWDQALSALGHDSEIKALYGRLLASHRRPEIFFDVGANYGMHALLLSVHGVESVAFEPNPVCHDYLRWVSELNRIALDIRPVALGDTRGYVDLWYPASAPWLGTTDIQVRDGFTERPDTTSVRVECWTLDQAVSECGRRPDLIKIDVEGAELRVLKGASSTLRTFRPWVVLESWAGWRRNELAGFLQSLDYDVVPLTRGEDRRGGALGSRGLCESPYVNFLAFPTEHWSLVSSILDARA